MAQVSQWSKEDLAREGAWRRKAHQQIAQATTPQALLEAVADYQSTEKRTRSWLEYTIELKPGQAALATEALALMAN